MLDFYFLTLLKKINHVFLPPNHKPGVHVSAYDLPEVYQEIWIDQALPLCLRYNDENTQILIKRFKKKKNLSIL